MTNESQLPTDSLREAVESLSPQKRQLLSKHLAAATTQRLRPLARTPGRNIHQSSIGQEGLYFANEAAAGSTNNLMPIAVRFTGELREDLLAAALSELVRRHEALRTGLDLDAAHGLRQTVWPPEEVRLDLPVEEVTGDQIADLITGLTTKPFRLDTPPLIRAALWRWPGPAGTEWVLGLCVHHIVVDGWSLDVLVEDLTTVYTELFSGIESSPQDLSFQFADFAAWQREWLAQAETASLARHWDETLAGAKAPILSLAPVKPEVPSPVRVELPPALMDALAKQGQQERATPFMMLLAAFAVVLSRWSGQTDMLLATMLAGRAQAEFERVVGFFAGTVPLRLAWDPSGSFPDLLRRTRTTCLTAYAHQGLPLNRALWGLAGARGATALPVMFALRDVPAHRLRLPDVEAELLPLPPSGTDYPLSLELARTEHGGVAGWLLHAPGRFGQEWVEQVAADVHNVLARIAERGDCPLPELLLGMGGPPATVTAASGVEIHGYRVNPADTTAVLCEHPAVDEAVVLASTDRSGETQLIAYVTESAPGDSRLSVQLLREELTTRLPEPLIPRSLFVLDALPRTQAGKIDRSALPFPAEPDSASSPSFAPPADALEEVLAQIWTGMLDTNDVGVHDSFFQLGGHSLTATMLVSQIRELFRIELRLSSFVESPTVSALAQHVREEGKRQGTDVHKIAELILRVREMTPAGVQQGLQEG